MSKVVIGKYVNTHGLKGEIRIKSEFEYKDRVFKIGNEIIINNIAYTIKTYRVHKGYDMVSLENINSIDEIPFMKNTFVYVNRENYLKENDYLDSDLIGFIVYNNELLEKVSSIMYLNGNKKLLNCHGKLIPFELIEKINFRDKKIKIMEVAGL